MNNVTATFANLDTVNLKQYLVDAKFYGLNWIETRINGVYVTLEMRGTLTMINAFDRWVTDPKNWTKKSLKGAK